MSESMRSIRKIRGNMIEFSQEVVSEIINTMKNLFKNVAYLMGHILGKLRDMGTGWKEIVHSFMEGYSHTLTERQNA